MENFKVGIDLAPASHRAPGTARHVAEQARAIFKLGVPWQWVPTVESESNPLWAEIQHLNPIIIPGKKIWTRATFSVGKAWRKAGCDLGFCTAYFVPWAGIPVVTNYFDSNNFEFGQTWIDSGRRWNFYLTDALSRYALWRSERLFVNSQYCLDVIEKHCPKAKPKLIKTPPGITSPMAKPHSSPKFTERLKKPFFLYVGVFSENKNQRRLLEAWKMVQEHHPSAPSLVLAGSYSEDYYQAKIIPAVNCLPRKNEVLLPGRVSDEELAWLYHHATAYVQPSIAEGFGLPVAEAMSYGLPVTCSDTTSLPETAGDAAIYFNPTETGSIYQSLNRLITDTNLRASLSVKGLNQFQKFTWNHNAVKIAASIQSFHEKTSNSH